MMSYEYKSGGVGMLKVLLESENLSDLLNNMHYVDSVQKAQAEEIELQRGREEAFNAALDDLNDKKDEQMAKLAEAEQKTAEAAQVVSGAEAQLAKAKDEAAAAAEAERLAALKAQAEALAAEQEKAAAAETPALEQTPEEPSSQESNPSDNGAGNAGSNSGSSGGSSDGAGGEQAGWKTGSASAYGSTSDGTLGQPTASGALVTETLHGRCHSAVVAQCPFVSGAPGGNQLWWHDRHSHGERPGRHGRRLAFSRSAAGRMEGARRQLLPRLGRAYGELPFPVRIAA